LRVLTWNLFHGRSLPNAGRDLYPDFAAALAGWDWDVALLQEVPPWWPAKLGTACAAVERHALTSRNLLLPIRRCLATQFPDVIKSNGGGCNAILVRAGGIHAHAVRRLRLHPERRVAHGVKLDDGSWVVNLHATVHDADKAREDVVLAARSALEWSAGQPVILGGDLNVRTITIDGFTALARHDVDWILGHGSTRASEPEVLERDTLSDHAPVAVAVVRE
jgi:endonuclease/exonuclease/phosphatase family metal-dependent hydrolase